MMRRSNLLQWAAVGGVMVILLVGYLSAATSTTFTGYPLDDAWIHQTYARNLGIYGEWAFWRGQPSAGSTAPAWTFWLALGYGLGINHFIWSFLSGALALGVIGYLSAKIISRLTHQTGAFPWIAIFMVGEWHLVWAALSGMETILMSAVIVLAFLLMTRDQANHWLVGILIGAACWLRPDGITLLGPALLLAVLANRGMAKRGYAMVKLVVGFLLLFLPYLLFNQAFAGSIWPNTFFAKQAEYASHLQAPLVTRLVSMFGLPLVGAGVALAPGFFFACYRFVKDRFWWGIGAVLWWAGFTLIYALRLPVTYQHGRYLIPAMPVFWLIGVVGTFYLSKRIETRPRVSRLIRFGLGLSLGLLLLLFNGLGMTTYAEDVAIINTEMVSTAQWVAKNTPPEALVGAHDIGALGYFGERELVDLAGLVSPEVVPFIRDENRLLDFLHVKKASYLVTFPGWYPRLVDSLQPIYQSDAPFSPAAGGENMAVYPLEE